MLYKVIKDIPDTSIKKGHNIDSDRTFLNIELLLQEKFIQKPFDFQEGEWVLVKSKPKHGEMYKALVRFTDKHLSTNGFNHAGNWTDGYGIANAMGWGDAFESASGSIIANALIAEAKYRGFYFNVTISRKGFESVWPDVAIPHYNQDKWEYVPLTDDCPENRDTLHLNGKIIYERGVWATIIAVSTLAGHKVEVLKGIVKIGCKDMSTDEWNTLQKLINRFNVESIETKHGTVTRKELANAILHS